MTTSSSRVEGAAGALEDTADGLPSKRVARGNRCLSVPKPCKARRRVRAELAAARAFAAAAAALRKEMPLRTMSQS